MDSLLSVTGALRLCLFHYFRQHKANLVRASIRMLFKDRKRSIGQDDFIPDKLGS